eukprot:CAMPEP_0113499134 /NCGR_PEP_ID=MMETSP0014_2-20120614/31576_1 /TAXON_ID=2857 /ORGANISM="Nitzschia sp." /LENGTH=910 /DNA_ID=CAMNT_0000393269 /DNA_START=16 /DNA_END=2748 /DNA_ORIENTATION=- /assembly_acc=CAM_ASM_000159
MATATGTPRPSPYYKQLSEDVKVVRKLLASSSPSTASASSTTFLPAPVLQSTISSSVNQSANIDVLQQGIKVSKLSTRGVWNPRFITLSSDKFAFFITHHKLHAAAATTEPAAAGGGMEDKLRSYTAKLPIPLWTPSHGLRWKSSLQSKDGDTSSLTAYTRYLDIADIDGWQVGLVGTQILEYSHRAMVSGNNTKGGLKNENDVSNIVTIFHGGYQKAINLLIRDKNHRQALVETLQQLKRTYNTVVKFVDNEQLLLRYVYYDIDVDSNGFVNSKEFNSICKRINLELKGDRNMIFQQYVDEVKETRTQQQQELMQGRPNELTSSETQDLIESISSKGSPAYELWDTLFGPKSKSVSKAQFHDEFLVKCQGEVSLLSVDSDVLMDSLSLFTAQGPSKSLLSKKAISKAQFVSFLYSDLNSAYDPNATKALPPKSRQGGGGLNKPLSYYWINTSHNTYLMGDQLQSWSSVEAYMRALYRGCKCLELDCWDDSDNKKNQPPFKPVVYHGHTLTSKIEFRSICVAVKKYLDANPNTYPIILSLENHCSHPYQRTMATDMKKIFGKLLFVPSGNQTSGGTLPSPEHLRGMVVIKGKRPPEADEDGQNPKTRGKADKAAVKKQESYAGEENGVDQYDAAQTGGHHSKIDPELANLTLFHGVKFKNFNESIEMNPSHMHSIGESKIKKIVGKKNAGKMWRKYNIQHLTRTYPAGTRVDSSNYNPVLPWAMGSQLVALNFQTSDVPLVLNDGMFKQAGGCGYVEKPKSIVNGAPFNRKNIRIEVLSAQCLPKPNGVKKGETIDPYIQIDLHDVRISEDETKEGYTTSSFKTSSIDNNGLCPVWTDTQTEFEVCNADVAMLLFKIVDEDWDLDDMIASCAIPVRHLRKGYRSIILCNHNGTRSGAYQSATLLVKIEEY